MSPKKDHPKVAIIVLNWNGKQDTLDCLESLGQLTYSNYEVIVVDNGSSDGSAAAVRKCFPQHILIENQENLGYAEGNNVGLRSARERGADLFFLLNNDTVVAPDILERFLESFQSRHHAGILGAKILLHDQRQTLDHLGGFWDIKTGTFLYVGKGEMDEQGQLLKELDYLHELDYVCGAGMIIQRNVIEAVGYLDPRFFLIWEDSDYCFRARAAGFKIFTCPRAKLWHKVSASFTGGKAHSTYYWWRNRLLWIEKNCTDQEKFSLYFRILIPEIFHKLKILLLKKCQLLFSKSKEEKRRKISQNRAALCGFRDYLLRRFGKGPVWLDKKKL